MAKISTYVINTTPTLSDMLIGTDVDSLYPKDTKNFSIGSLITVLGVGSIGPQGVTGPQGSQGIQGQTGQQGQQGAQGAQGIQGCWSGR